MAPKAAVSPELFKRKPILNFPTDTEIGNETNFTSSQDILYHVIVDERGTGVSSETASSDPT